MILKHSVKSVLRTPKKSLLFLFLLMVLTILLSIGIGMFEAARNMLQDADKTFTSIAQLNYLSDVGSEEESFYQKMNTELEKFEFNQLAEHFAVKSIGREKTAWAFIEGDVIKRNYSPMSDYVMIKVGSIIESKENGQENLFMGVISETLFGRRARENAYVLINGIDEQGFPLNYTFNRDHEYIIVGKIINGRTPTLIISPEIPKPAESLPSIVDVTEQPDYLLTEEGKQMLSLQMAMNVVDNSLQVTTVSSLEAYSPFYYKEMIIKEGRSFNPSEYQQGKNEVILISKALADFYKVGIGDELHLKLHSSNNGIGFSDFLKGVTYDYEADYEVVGIIENKTDNRNMIYMPEADWLEQKLHSIILARYIVKNGSGEKFMKENQKLLLPNMEFTLYDQGYAETIKPIVALRNNAIIILLLGTISGIAILILFSYLYVIKQKDTLRTMLSLGTGKRRTRNYILFGSMTLVFCASSISAILSSGFLNRITELLFEAMEDTYGTDLRYSERSIGVDMNFVPQVKVTPWLPAIVIAFILMISFILLFFITNFVLQEDKEISVKKIMKQRAVIPRKVAVKKIKFGRVRPLSFKFALLSLTRSPGRSLIIPFISLILSIFIIFLGLFSSMQQAKLDTVYDRIPVTAYVTSSRNDTRVMGGILLDMDIYPLVNPNYSQELEWMNKEQSEDYIQNDRYTSLKYDTDRKKILESSKFVSQMHLYTAVKYEFMGISKTKDGETNNTIAQLPEIRIHNNAFGYDWFLIKIRQMPRLSYADNISYTPDFFNDSKPEMEFLDGYDYDSLRKIEDIAFISKDYAKEHGIENGDTIRITAWQEFDELAICSMMDLKVVGIYDVSWKTDVIYIPWIKSYEHIYYIDFDYPRGEGIGGQQPIPNAVTARYVRAVTLTLKNTEELSAFRNYLEDKGYSQVGKVGVNRKAIVIQDKRLMDTVQNLKSFIRLIEIIQPIMMILFGVIGFAVSYLLMKHRTNEFAIMRSIGAKKRQVFLSFYLEQLLLFMAGLLPAVIYAIILPQKIAYYGASLVYFIVCYLFGTALALIIMNRAKILDVLFTKE